MASVEQIEGKPVGYWESMPGGRIRCLLCPCHCVLKEGQRGACFVRACSGGQMLLTTYGRSSGFCIDPIEKKPLNHFLPGTPILSFGTAGCNLACSFCQNWDISKSREWDRLTDLAMPETIARAAQQLGCPSVAFTYNDPVIFMEYATDIAEACHALGVKTVAVTAGYIEPEPRKEFYRHMDAANIDLKGFTPSFYQKLCGGELDPVLDTLKYVRHHTRTWLEITTLLIPGENDSDSELAAMSAWLMENLGADVPLHFTAFHPDYKMQDHPPTPAETLVRARDIAMRAGLHYVYTGNVHNEACSSTWCHVCGAKLIGRDWYQITSWNLAPGGKCPSCGALCAGLFEDRPGRWGPKRRPVDLKPFM